MGGSRSPRHRPVDPAGKEIKDRAGSAGKAFCLRTVNTWPLSDGASLERLILAKKHRKGQPHFRQERKCEWSSDRPNGHRPLVKDL